MLLAQLHFGMGVLRRVETIAFQDERSAVREMTVYLRVRDDAAVFVNDAGVEYWLVPLTLMRRRTLVDFHMPTEDDQPVRMPGLRLAQQLDESILMAAAATTTRQLHPVVVLGHPPVRPRTSVHAATRADAAAAPMGPGDGVAGRPSRGHPDVVEPSRSPRAGTGAGSRPGSPAPAGCRPPCVVIAGPPRVRRRSRPRSGRTRTGSASSQQLRGPWPAPAPERLAVAEVTNRPWACRSCRRPSRRRSAPAGRRAR